jgi:hypothetical protein
MDIATALTAKLNEDAQSSNLVNEVSSRLASELGAEIQRTFPHMSGLAALSRAQEMVNDCVSFYRSGAGYLPPMSEPVLGLFLRHTEAGMLNCLSEQFQIALAVSKNNRAQYNSTYQLMSARP